MEKGIKSKIALKNVAYSVRATQAVLQYGVGAMVDFPEQTLVTAAPETWEKTSKIYDDRFAKALDVEYFALPINISYSRFPEWYFCPKCRKFQPLSSWIKEYRAKANPSKLEADPYMTRNLQCVKCHQDLVASRIVTICENGHLNDFPWEKWVHTRARKPICANPCLKFKTGASSTEGLEGLSVSCTCGASTSLKGAFDPNIFKELDEKNETENFLCTGHHPFKNSKSACGCYPRTVQRGASSVYFPVTYSSLVIPPYADLLNTRIEKSKTFDECLTIIADAEPEEKKELIEKRLVKWSKKIALEIGTSAEEVEKLLRSKLLDESDKVEVTSIKYKIQEYQALSGEIVSPGAGWGDFVREQIDISEYGIPHVMAVSLIDKVRVVNALIGFSRITPALSPKDEGFVSIKESSTKWYPACEVRGEGIFIEFDNSEIENWVASNPEVIERAKIIQGNYNSSFIGKNHPRKITPKFIMLHTLSHLLIKQLSFECGYSIASLNERIYCSDIDEGKVMAGVFIYTASGDSEGTLGGLVRQGMPDALPSIIRRAIRDAKTCSNDPVCILSRGQGRDSLNLAACHTCGLLPETCCEERNGFLDRGLIVGTYKEPQIGFWKELL